MKKILLLILSVFIIYALLVFLSPETSSKIEEMFGFSGTTDKIRNIKTQFDTTVTDVPSPQEVKSWALDIRDSLKNGLDLTKWKIDSVRSTLSWAQESFNETMDTIDTTIETVKSAKEAVDKFSEKWDALQQIGDSIKWSIDTESGIK